MSDVSVTVTGENEISITVASQITGATGGGIAQMEVSGGTAVAYGGAVYVHTDGTVRPGYSLGTDLEAYVEGICVEIGGVADGATGSFFFGTGIISDLSGGTSGALAYVGETPGEITTVVPTTGYSKIIGKFLSAEILKFSADPAFYPFQLQDPS